MALSKLTLTGEIYFSQDFAELTIRPRLFPLIVGPTGTGKTTLVRRCADDLQASFFRVTFGDWLPRGVNEKSGTQTLFVVLEQLQRTERLVLQVDELDKWREDFGGSWSRSVANDLWNLLDGFLPIADFLRANSSPTTADQIEKLQRKIRENLFIVGTGTWQSVFVDEDRAVAGFGTSMTCQPDDTALTMKIRKSRAIPDELLARFSSELLILRYPTAAVEVQALLDGFGITALAKKLGQVVRPDTIDLTGVGLR